VASTQKEDTILTKKKKHPCTRKVLSAQISELFCKKIELGQSLLSPENILVKNI